MDFEFEENIRSYLGVMNRYFCVSLIILYNERLYNMYRIWFEQEKIFLLYFIIENEKKRNLHICETESRFLWNGKLSPLHTIYAYWICILETYIFSVWFVLSSKPFVWGWYAAVTLCLTFHSLHSLSFSCKREIYMLVRTSVGVTMSSTQNKTIKF